MSQEAVNRGVNVGVNSPVDIDASLLLDIDVSSLTVTTVPTDGRELLTLEDLESIDWDLVTTSVLGITDPIGQLREWLAGVLSSLFDSLRRLIDSMFAILRDMIGRIASVLDRVAEGVRALVDTIRGVIVTPILEALRWVQTVLPSLADMIRGAVTTLTDFIRRLPDIARDFAVRVADVFAGLVDRVRVGLEVVVRLLSTIPDTIRELMTRVSTLFSELLDKVKSGLEGLLRTLATIPDTIRELLARASEAISNLVEALRGGLEGLLRTITGIPDTIRDVVGRITSMLTELLDRARSGIEGILDLIPRVADTLRELTGKVSALFTELVDKVRAGFQTLLELISRAPDTIRDLLARASEAISGFIETIRSGLEGLLRAITGIYDVVRDVTGRITSVLSEILDRVRAGVEAVIEAIARAGESVRDLVARASDAISSMLDRVAESARSVLELLAKAPDHVRGLLEAIAGQLAELLDRSRAGVAGLLELVPRVAEALRDLAGRVATAASDILDRVKAGVAGILDLVPRIAETLRDLAGRVAEGIAGVASRIQEALSRLVETIARAPEILRAVIDRIVGDVVTGVGGVVEWVRRGFESVTVTLREWFERSREWFEAATATLREVGYVFMGFVNAVLELPRKFAEVFKPVPDFFAKLLEALGNFARDPVGWFRTNIVEPLLGALAKAKDALLDIVKALINAVLGALGWIWDRATDFVTKVSGKVVEFGRGLVSTAVAVAETVAGFFDSIIAKWTVKDSPEVFNQFQATAKDVESVLQASIVRTAGVAENLWLLGGGLLIPYWRATLVPLVLRGIVRTFGDFDITIEPSVAGSKTLGLSYRIKASELADALARGFEVYVTGYAIGASMAIASTVFVNIQHLYVPRVIAYYDEKIKDLLRDVLAKEIEDEATINMFIKPVSETALIDYARRSLAQSEGLKNEKVLKQLLATVRAHLKIYGLPKWYIEWLTKHPEELRITFKDRFGADRRLYLSHIFELPTHSEMARMTQRDIFPGVDVMKRLGWVRGWNEDLTTMIYLLTFRYPSFEKLWTFYMRALSGMLWFKAPEHIKMVFDREAEEIEAGKPISPLDLQKAMLGPDQVKAFETALNTYFKWLEYSNFSWFTDKTVMYGINVGAEIVGKLGGWTADSWLMIDVAADIPTKIDMRWMSRYGIFLHMARRFEEAGVRFESYVPMVTVVTRLLEPQAATPIQVDLRWFSKLLQATGLHPAWVPVTTVAENIMVIADEMTLLRTGWLNLFKEGMITVEDAERYLAGLLTVSYHVGYWDPERKVWTSGWINLPVRWLPHERRLLQLRMAIDRTMDVYREIYSYIRSGIRTLAITPEEGLEKLKALIKELDKHYRELTKQITGIEMTLRLDEGYATMWLELQKLAQDIEAYERIRIWWSRTSGWLLYRVAYGWVTDAEIEDFIATVAKFIPLHPKEVEAYKEIAKALLGIARKENIPSPSTLATFAEYMIVEAKTVEDVLSKYNVPKEYWELWKTYIQLKPIKSDYKAVINVALRALRYGAISKEEFEGILTRAQAYGFTPVEVALLQLRAELEHAIDETKLWRPSLLTLIGMIEYVPEARELLRVYKVDPRFTSIVEKYALVKPLADEVRVLVNALYRAKRYVAIPKELEEKVISIVKQLGVTDAELAIRDLALELQVLVDEAKVWVPTPTTLATLSEYVVLPKELVEGALKARRIPEEWMSIWLQYITVKPVKSDYKAVLMVALRALRYNVITKEHWDGLLKAATQYGFTPPEIALLQLRAELELLIEEARLWRPTLTTLITMIEYVPEAVELLKYYKVDPVFRPVVERYAKVKPLADEVRVLVGALYRAKRYVTIPKELEERVVSIAKSLGVTDEELMLRDLALELQVLVDEARVWVPTPTTLATLAEYVVLPRELVESALKARRVPEEWMSIWLEYITVKPVKSDYRAVLMTALRALRYNVISREYWDELLKVATQYGFTPTEIVLLQLRAELELLIEEARLWRPSLLTLIGIIEYVPEARELLKVYRVDPVFANVIERYARVKPLADEARVLVNSLYRAKRYTTIPTELEKRVVEVVKALGVTDEELMLRDLALELQVLADEARVWIPSPTTLAVLAEYVMLPRELIESALRARRIPEEWMSIWLQYITVRPLKPDYRAVISTAIRALRYRAITDEQWRRILDMARLFGFTDPEIALIQLRAELEMAIEEAREHVPTPAMLATIAEVVPEARRYMSQVFEVRRVRGVWAEVWARYIHLRPVVDDVRRWASAMFDLAERLIITVEQLKPIFDILKTYGWEDLEVEIARRTVLAVQARIAFGEAHGTVRALAGMARWSDRAADLAYSRALKLIEALPVDNTTKELLKQMWREYIVGTQVHLEARSYIGELVAAYGDMVIDDTTLDRELEYLKKLGVPETRLALVKRQAMLRRARRLARARA